MTSPLPPGGGSPASTGDDSRDPEHPARPDSGPPGEGGDAPGLLTFTLDGRRAPALFLVGWLATLAGLGAALVGFFAGGGLAGGILFTLGLAVLSAGLLAAGGSQAIERRRAAGRRYSGPSPIVAFLAVIALTLLFVVVVGTPLVALGIDSTGPLAVFVSILVTALAYLGVVRLLVVGTGALSWRDLGVTRLDGAALADLAWGGVLAVPVLVVTGLVGLVLSQVLPIPAGPLPPAPDTPALVLNLLTAALIAPIGEELFFRGFATTAWLRQHGVAAAIVRGAVFFAVAHALPVGGSTATEGLGLATFALVVRLPVAVALGWLFVRRRSLWAPVGLHAVFNALQVVAASGAAS